MHYINIFWTNFTGIEFVLYIIMPTTILLVILTYILFNIRLIAFAFDCSLFSYRGIKTKMEDKLQKSLDKN